MHGCCRAPPGNETLLPSNSIHRIGDDRFGSGGWVRRAAVLSITVLVAAAGCFAGRAGAADEPPKGFEEFESRLETVRQALGIPGMAAAVVSDQELVWASGFGFADLENQIEATASTPFGLASVTKPVAATLVMMLVEEGVIDLDTPVADYGVRVIGDNGITVRHLLTHTSEGTPGTSFAYNGDRYGLLGGVIEGATGRTFAELLSERILLPLDLTDTALNPLNSWSGVSRSGFEDFARALGLGEAFAHYPDVYRRLARPYQFGNAHETIPGMYHLFHNPAAGLVSSVSDLAVFDIALDRDDLLGPATRVEMHSPAFLTVAGREDLNYGLGWYVQDFAGTRLLWHTGRWPPSTSALYLKVPSEGLTFIVLANTDNLTVPFPNIGSGDLARSILFLTFYRHFLFPALRDHQVPAIDWSAGRSELVEALAAVEDNDSRRFLERELWSFRQALASSGQVAQAEILLRVANTVFPGSELARDASFTSTVGAMPVIRPIASARAFAAVSRGVIAWLALVALSLVWMVLRLVRTRRARLWNWAVWLTATALLGPIAPLVHMVGGRPIRASVFSVVGYSLAWVVAVIALLAVAGEPSPPLILGSTVLLPVLVGLFMIRAPVLRRAGIGSYADGLRRGILTEMVTWGFGFAVFFPLTFFLDDRWLSTIPSPSSPFFGAMMSVLALAGLAVLLVLHTVMRRLGFTVGSGSVLEAGEPGETLRLPRLRDSWWLLLIALLVLAGSLAFTVSTLG